MHKDGKLCSASKYGQQCAVLVKMAKSVQCEQRWQRVYSVNKDGRECTVWAKMIKSVKCEQRWQRVYNVNKDGRVYSVSKECSVNKDDKEYTV